MTATGNLIQSTGTINIDGGKLLVGGDYRIQSINTSNGVTSYGGCDGALLIMTNNSDYVLVNGSFVTGTNEYEKGYLTAGIMEVKGDFYEKYYYYECYNDTTKYNNAVNKKTSIIKSINNNDTIPSDTTTITKGDDYYHVEETDGSMFKLTENEDFVRVYNTEEGSSKGGQFVMRLSDIRNSNGSLMTAQEIKDKFSLPNLPDTLQSATISKGTIMDCGIAGPIEGWGNGRGLQFDLHNVMTGVFTDIQSL